VATPGTADADQALSAAVASVNHAMAQMQSEIDAPPAQQANYVPTELLRPFDVNLPTVDLDQAAGVLSGYAGYQLDVVNPDKLSPPMVSLTGVRVPLIDLFRSLGAQGGTQVDVSVNADTKSVQVTYHNDVPHA
jgi:hypothetical protein